MASTRVRHANVIVVGAGALGRRVAERLGAGWTVTFVDIDPRRGPGEIQGAAAIQGDGTSRLVLEQAGADQADALLALTADDRTNLETARLAREVFGLRRVLVSVRDPANAGAVEALGAEPIDVHAMTIGTILGRLEPTIRPAVSIGLGQGEIVEVTVLGSSAVIGRPLRYLGAKDWLVAAVYRQERLIVPHGDTILESGDRVVLVGAPSALPSIAEFFRAGASAFPLPYGRRIGVVAPAVGDREFWLEIESLIERSSASGLDVFGPGIDNSLSAHLWHDVPPERAVDEAFAFPGVGCVVLAHQEQSLRQRFGLSPSYLRAALRQLRVPLLVARGTFPYRRVMLASLDYTATRAAAEVAVGLAALWNAELSGVTACPPAFVAGPRAVAEQLDALAETDQIARVHGVRFAEHHLSGNPIRQIVERANADADLLILGSRIARPLPLVTDVVYEIAARSRCSILVIPESVPS